MNAAVPPEYQWLHDALAPHCDKVICDVCDYDGRIGIGVSWTGPPRVRQALIVRGSGRRAFDLNALIAAGKDSRKRVIRDLLRRKR